MGEVDILALEQLVRTPFRSGGIKYINEDGQQEFLPGPERIPRTRGRNEIYLNNKKLGDMGAKLIGNETTKYLKQHSLIKLVKRAADPPKLLKHGQR